MKRLLACAALAAALLLIVLHVQPSHSVRQWHLVKPNAVSVSSMPLSLPKGEIAVNRATVEELDALPHVGPVVAREIIAERERDGAFHYPQDLLCVRGIGESTLQKLLEHIRLD